MHATVDSVVKQRPAVHPAVGGARGQARSDIDADAAPHVFPAMGFEPADDTTTSASWLLRVLDEIDYGVMLVGGDAKLHFANVQALDACAPGQALQIENNRVVPRRCDERAAFAAALAAARAGRHSMLQVRPAAADAGSVSLACVPLDAAADAPDGRAVLLVFGRRQACEPLSVQFFARTHGLTGAEAAVLAALCQGQLPSAIASEGNIAISTVRTHIGSIRQKTGSNSIGELVRRVSTLPPMVGVLKRSQAMAGMRSAR